MVEHPLGPPTTALIRTPRKRASGPECSVDAQKPKCPNPEVEEGDRHGPGDDAPSNRVIGRECHDEPEDASAKEQHGPCNQVPAKPAGLRLHRLKRNRVLPREHLSPAQGSLCADPAKEASRAGGMFGVGGTQTARAMPARMRAAAASEIPFVERRRASPPD